MSPPPRSSFPTPNLADSSAAFDETQLSGRMRLPIVVRRFLLWTVICSVSAAPSFSLGLQFGSAAGMVAGVAIFVLLYTAVTCTQRFERFYRRPFIRATMYVGYGARLLLSGLTLLSVFGASPFLIWPDLWCGLLSIRLAGAVGAPLNMAVQRSQTASSASVFIGVFVTTCIQGALLNVVVFAVMGIAYLGQRLFRRWPDDDRRIRGFEVLPTAAVAESQRF